LVISVNTNGTFITPEVVELFRRHPPEAVNVTLYGASPETYGRLCGVKDGYERAVEGICALKQAGVRVVLNTTFTTCNQGDMEALVAMAKELELPIRTAAYTFPPVRNRHEDSGVCLLPAEQAKLNARFEFLATRASRRVSKADYLRRCLEAEEARNPNIIDGQGKPSSCMAGRGMFWMAWNGEMYPCGMLSDYAVKPSEGGMDFADMWRQTHTRTEAIYLPAACAECALRRVCPSCAAVTHSNHGDTAKLVEGMCTYTKTYINTFLELMDTMGDGGEVAAAEGGDVDPFVCL
jgi:radical SAM protein with 4Fe4S-binding SPASM domain